MTTYKKIQKRVKDTYGRVPKTCWIAHCKELEGLPVKRAHNRVSDKRMVPCEDPKMRDAIVDAFKHFKML